MKRILRKLQRAISYAIFGYNNEDYDYSFIYELLEYKLKRTERALINGISEHDKSTLQSLRIALRLLNRINKKEYTYFLDQHDEKWGKPILSVGPIQVIERPNVMAYDRTQERAELIEAMTKDDAQEIRDITLLHNIMAKYSRAWWD